jgi:pyruvate dehydrogenase E2 component (dihydrolipoamide acetyltransferase)
MPDVIMPQMGESIVEGTVTKWFKKVGDRVERDEPLFEISTDKVDTEIPAPAAGVLTEILVNEGQTVQVNTVVARIGDGPGAAAPAPAQAPAKAPAPPAAEARPPAPPAAPAPVPEAAEAPEEAAEAGEEPRSSPLVRRLAKEHNIDLRLIKGTGQGGRISKKDIEDYLAQRAAAPAPALAETAPPAAAPPQPERPAPAGPALPVTAFPPAPAALFGRYRVEKLSNMRQRIAEHMVLSKHVSPHVSTVQQVDATKVARLRERVKAQFEQQNGVKLTFLPFFIRAACAALKAFPIVNASLDGTNIVYHQDINIGIAVALDWGLIVPVIRNADERNFLGLQRAVNDLAQRARRKQLRPDEVQEGTFSISNYGSFGSLFATPVINQPQAAILGVGQVHKAPVVIDDAIAIRTIVYLTLSFDHRILDGAIADQFLGHVKRSVEEWSEEIL